MGPKMFGELFKELRQKRGFTLRAYCRTFEKDPGNISRMERGLLSPPTDTEHLTELALSVGLKEGTERWTDFFTTAVICAGRLPIEIVTDEDVLRHLPILLRTIKGQKISEEKLHALIQVIKNA